MTLRDVFRLQGAAKCERRGRGRNAARSRLAKGIFPFQRSLTNVRNARCLNDARSPGSWQGKNPFLTPGANAPLMRPRPLRYYRGQLLRASRRNTSLRSDSCPSAEHERSKLRAFSAHGEGGPEARKRPMGGEAKAVPAHGESGPQGRKGSMGEDLRMTDDAAGCIPASAHS